MRPSLSDLELAAQKHRYKLLDGRTAINVTAISKMLDRGKSSAMAYVAARLTSEGLNYREEWERAAEDGTRRHGHCETWLHGDPVECEEIDQGFLDGLQGFFQKYDPRPLAIESVVLSQRGYGGRLDFIANFEDQNTLVDLKTGKQYPLEHTLQLAALRHADGIAKYGDDGNLTGMDPLPRIDRAGCLYITATGEFEFVEYPADALAFDIFCDLLKIHISIPFLLKEMPRD